MPELSTDALFYSHFLKFIRHFSGFIATFVTDNSYGMRMNYPLLHFL